MTRPDDLDALLADWARAPVAGSLPDLAAIAAMPQQAASSTRWRWLAGGSAAMAAALAALWFMPGMAPEMIGAPAPAPQVMAAAPPTNKAATTSPLADAGSDDTAAFATVFTPTDVEEDLI
jgi:hypothetical protein